MFRAYLGWHQLNHKTNRPSLNISQFMYTRDEPSMSIELAHQMKIFESNNWIGEILFVAALFIRFCVFFKSKLGSKLHLQEMYLAQICSLFLRTTKHRLTSFSIARKTFFFQHKKANIGSRVELQIYWEFKKLPKKVSWVRAFELEFARSIFHTIVNKTIQRSPQSNNENFEIENNRTGKY